MKKINIDKQMFIYGVTFFALFIIFGISIFFSYEVDQTSSGVLEGEIVSTSEDSVIIRDAKGNEYMVNVGVEASIGDKVVFEYAGNLDLDNEMQEIKIVKYDIQAVSTVSIPDSYDDNGIFSDYYELAYDKLNEMNLDEKIRQLLLVRYPDNNGDELLKEYGFAGYVFYEKDFQYRTKDEVVNMMDGLQEVSDIPIITAVDEEGGSVVRVSSNPALRDEPFMSPSELYASGGLDMVSQDTKEKSKLLKSLGINVNLAPVVDVVTENSAYMYDRSLKEDTSVVSQYAKTVIEASKGTGVSYTLKHFPGYGNNVDTHEGKAVDERDLEEIMSDDIPPFEAGIKAGAEAVLISHNIVSSIDMANPASLSSNVHSLLRDDLRFTGVIITDDIQMDSVSGIEDVAVFAVKAGNDLIITTDYENSFNDIKTAVKDGELTEEMIDELVFRTLAWKYYKGLMFDRLK